MGADGPGRRRPAGLGGDPLFLANWMRRSGLTGLLPTLRSEAVYVGVSAGSIAAASTFVETYAEPPRGTDGPLKSEDIVFATPQGDVDRILVTGQGAGLVDFAVIPHLEHADHPDASLANGECARARRPPLSIRSYEYGAARSWHSRRKVTAAGAATSIARSSTETPRLVAPQRSRSLRGRVAPGRHAAAIRAASAARTA